MKILFVDMEFDYGVEARGPNLIGQLGFIKSLRELGHEVIPFYYDSYLTNTDPLQQALLDKANEVKPDLIFFSLFRDQFKKATLLKLKERFTTLNWFGDDSWRFDDFTCEYANCFTCCATTDKFSIDKYHRIGQKNIFMSQWAVINTPILTNIKVDYEFDVSFVGAKNYPRELFVQTLKKRGIVVACFGHGWGNGIVPLERMNEVFLKSKINLNLSNSKCFDIRYVFSHPINLAHTIKAKKNATQMKARHFEICYNGGFQLTDFSAGLEDYFTVGKEIACYRDIDELTRLVQYYLSHDCERELIKNAGFKRAVNEHTYRHRLSKLIEQIQGLK